MRKFGPKLSDHPSVGQQCRLCRVTFAEGDYTALVPIRPADGYEAEKAARGAPYNAVAEEVHWDCVEGK